MVSFIKLIQNIISGWFIVMKKHENIGQFENDRDG